MLIIQYYKKQKNGVKMKVSKSQLQEALEKVKPGLADKEIIEQTMAFVFEGNKVITYNDHISLSHPVEGLDIDIKGAIKAEELYGILSKLKRDELNLNVKEGKLYLKSGKAEICLLLTEKIKLPLSEIQNEKKWKELPDNFNHFMKFAMATCSKDFSQPVLTCVHVNENGYLESTDDYKITRCFVEGKMPVGTFLIPATSVNEVVKIGPKYIDVSNSWAHFMNENQTMISCRVYEEDFPKISDHLEVRGVEFEFPKAMKDILERASVFAKRDNVIDEEVTISIEKGKIEVSSFSDTGSFKEKSYTNYDNDPIKFIIVPYLLSDILDETRKCVIGKNSMKFQGEGWEYVSVLQKEE